MPSNFISLFMWGYQTHFRHALKYVAKTVFEELGAHVQPDVLLVGARIPEKENSHDVCVEPEEAGWPLALFDGLLESIEAIVESHDLQNMFYGDRRSMEEKPEVMRRDSVRQAVSLCLEQYDRSHKVRSFCGGAVPVGDFYVVPVVQVPEWLFEQFPPLLDQIDPDPYISRGPRSFIQAAISILLDEATKELSRPDPGRSFRGTMRRADEIVRDAATNFMHTPGLATKGRRPPAFE